MRLPPLLQRYADRLDAMSLRERVLIFLAVVAVLIAVADTALFEPILRRQKVNSQSIQQQEDEIRTMQLQVQASAQARAGYGANAMGRGWNNASSSSPRSTASSPQDKAPWFLPNAWRRCSPKS